MSKGILIFDIPDSCQECTLHGYHLCNATNADHVYILGNLSWKENEDAIAFVSTLRGVKHLILGNHDRCKDQRYRQLFAEIVNYKEIKDRVNGKEYHLVLSHFPIMFWNHQHQLRRDGDKQAVWAIQLYGHVHNSYEETIFQDCISKLNNEYNIKCSAYNVGCMLWDYTPRTLAEIMTADRFMLSTGEK